MVWSNLLVMNSFKIQGHDCVVLCGLTILMQFLQSHAVCYLVLKGSHTPAISDSTFLSCTIDFLFVSHVLCLLRTRCKDGRKQGQLARVTWNPSNQNWQWMVVCPSHVCTVLPLATNMYPFISQQLATWEFENKNIFYWELILSSWCLYSLPSLLSWYTLCLEWSGKEMMHTSHLQPIIGMPRCLS
jgi:hypothetical protein